MVKFPKVVIRAVVAAPSHHALGRYDPKKNEISFSSKEFFRHDERSKEYAIYHEIGHWFREEILEPKDIRGFYIFGMDDVEEGFADAFAAWFLRRNEFRRGYPRQFLEFAFWIVGREKEIQGFAKNILTQLENAEKDSLHG